MIFKKAFLWCFVFASCISLNVCAAQDKQPTLRKEFAEATTAVIPGIAASSAAVYAFCNSSGDNPNFFVGGAFFSVVGVWLFSISAKHSKKLYDLYKSDQNKEKKKTEKDSHEINNLREASLSSRTK